MEERTKCRGRRYLTRKAIPWCPAMLLVASLLGCGGVVGSGPSQPPPPPPVVTVSVTPSSATVLLGAQQTFSATVVNTDNTTVTWTVNGIAGGNPAVGTINASGVYTAPGILPPPGSISIVATSAADPSKTASASVLLSSDLSVSISPLQGSVELGASKAFAAAVTSTGKPNPGLTWAVSGSGCAGASCGTVDINGNYTAPQVLPAATGISLTATSIADPSKSAAAPITITSTFTVQVAGPATDFTRTVANYTATVVPAGSSNPSRVVAWGVSGAGCAGSACGTISSSGAYSAPNVPRRPRRCKSRRRRRRTRRRRFRCPRRLPPRSPFPSRPPPRRWRWAAPRRFKLVTGAQDATVTWDVGGTVGGNSTLGTILNSQTNPDNTTYTAPAESAGGRVSHRAGRSNANPNISASATITFTAANQRRSHADERDARHRPPANIHRAGQQHRQSECHLDGQWHRGRKLELWGKFAWPGRIRASTFR